jgi:uncharacterized membrane protein HdeD (DUF308 family)
MSANQETVDQRLRGARAGLWRLAGPWWLMLITGIAWLIISVVVLRFRLTSITTVGVLIGVVFLAATVNEFLLASVHVGWRWAHVLLGIFFLVGAIWAFANPINAFWALASVIGLLFVLYGALDIINSVAAREVSGTWWLGLVAGILLILLGFWASQQLFPARAALLLLWVGFFALFRGISEIVIAFELRSRQHA